jgi:hypothetical protein
MRVRVSVDAVVLDGLRVPARDRTALLARLETELGAQLSTLPAHIWSDPGDALTEPVQAAVTNALAVRPAHPGQPPRPVRPGPVAGPAAPGPGRRS